MFHCRVKNEMRMQSGERAHRDVRQRSIRRIWSSSLKALERVAAFTRTQKSHNCYSAKEKAWGWLIKVNYKTLATLT